MHAVLAADHVTGAAAAARDLVVVVEDADSLSGRVLGRAAALLDGRPDIGTVFVTDADVPEGVQRGDRWLRSAAAHGPDTVASSRAVMRRTTFEGVGRPELGTRQEQLVLWLRAATLAGVAHVADPLSLVTPTTRTPPVWVGGIAELHERAHAFRDLFELFPSARGQHRLKAAARRAIVRSARRRALVAAYDGDRIEASLCLHLARDVRRWER